MASGYPLCTTCFAQSVAVPNWARLRTPVHAQELEKLQFVLEFKIEELRGELEPKDQRIAQLTADLTVCAQPHACSAAALALFHTVALPVRLPEPRVTAR